jgi:acetylornithine deacetylase/succinyl-diaminopimelate desuccinylase-like protein
MKTPVEYINSYGERFVQELAELLRIKSVSTDPAFKDQVARCARHLRDHLERLGFEAEIYQTDRHPIVYAEWLEAGDQPTLLIYGHYDVQPPEPLELWHTGPFEPSVVEGNIYARGASDDKGQLFAHIKACEAYLKTTDALPVNVKFVLEGEEEVGSRSLASFIETHADLLRADVLIVSDSAQFKAGVPAITYALRGIVASEVVVRGPKQDLHSGGFGGTVANPANVLAGIIARLHDERGRVTVPGFYDDVLPLEEWERKAWAALPFDDEEYRELAGARELCGEEGFTTLERKWARPTLDVNGIYGGYMAEGSKTIIPSSAGAKISMRLVPDQDPERIGRSFEEHVRVLCPSTVELAMTKAHGSPPLLLPTSGPAMDAAAKAYTRGFGTKPVLIRQGGSIPIVTKFVEQLKVTAVLMGFGRPDDNLHSPNEKLNLGDFHKAILTSAYMLEGLAAG